MKTETQTQTTGAPSGALRLCTFKGCGRKHSAKGLCHTHYMQKRKGQKLRPIRPKWGPVCTFKGCGRKHDAKGLCHTHRVQERKGQKLHPIKPKWGPVCTFKGCGRKHAAKGLCRTHYWHAYNGQKLHPIKPKRGPVCTFKGCGRKHSAKGLCEAHYLQAYNGQKLRPIRIRKGYYITREGYVLVYKNGKGVMQHRVIMEAHLGQKLSKNQDVHHKNGIRSDNRLENLELALKGHGAGQTVKERVQDLEALGIKCIVPEKIKKVWG